MIGTRLRKKTWQAWRIASTRVYALLESFLKLSHPPLYNVGRERHCAVMTPTHRKGRGVSLIQGVRHFFTLMFILCLPHFSISQNLVPNPSFEEYFSCPGSYNYSTDGKLAPGWFSPTTGTPDLFNQCSRGEASIPTNWAGHSKAYTGKGYAGIFVYLTVNPNYREYLQTELTKPLEKGGEYYVEFYFKLSSNSKISIDRIGFLLSDSAHWAKIDKLFPVRPTYEFVMATPYSRSTGLWNKCSFTIVAKGGERFLTIGNFSSNDKTRSFKITFSKAKEAMLNKAAYFFIDDVKVVNLNEPPPEKPITMAGYPEIKLHETYVLKNIFFEFDSYQLVDPSFAELDKWYAFINAHPTWTLQLTGHTDERGTDEYNLKLSLQRVQSVADYLIQKGVDAKRIATLGEGKRKPLSQGKDETAHALNRRVEIKFLDQ